MTGDIGLEAHIAVFGRSYLRAVQIDIAIEDESAEVEAHATILPDLLGAEALAIPAFAHRLEAARSACTLVPGLFELEVMRQIDMAPAGIVERGVLGSGLRTQLELPVEVEELMLKGR